LEVCQGDGGNAIENFCWFRSKKMTTDEGLTRCMVEIVQEKTALLDSLRATLLKTIEDNNDVAEHNITLKKVAVMEISSVLPPGGCELSIPAVGVRFKGC
jgi:hypothetical protein